MRTSDVKAALSYFYAIPRMLDITRSERAALLASYNGVGAAKLDGLPKSTEPGRPTESAAVRLAAKQAAERVHALDKRELMLLDDLSALGLAVGCLHGDYQQLVAARYRDRLSWWKVARQFNAPESTVRHWNDRALERLGQALDQSQDAGELIARARRAKL